MFGNSLLFLSKLYTFHSTSNFLAYTGSLDITVFMNYKYIETLTLYRFFFSLTEFLHFLYSVN